MSQAAVGRNWLGYRGKLMRNNARMLQLRTTASYYYNCEQRQSSHTHTCGHKHTVGVKPRQTRRFVCASLISISLCGAGSDLLSLLIFVFFCPFLSCYLQMILPVHESCLVQSEDSWCEPIQYSEACQNLGQNRNDCFARRENATGTRKLQETNWQTSFMRQDCCVSRQEKSVT